MGYDGKTLFESSIERATGRDIDEIRDTPLSESRARIEEVCGKPMSVSYCPIVDLVSHEECNQACDDAIRGLSVPQKIEGFVSRAYAGLRRLFR